MGKIFISYAKEDKIKAMEIFQALNDKGYSTWIDTNNLIPGQDWETEIEKAIRESAIFIACLSNNSVNKRGYVQAELKKALKVAETIPESEIYIIPVRLEDCKVPESLLKLHWLNYYENDSDEKLLRAIQNSFYPSKNAEPKHEQFYEAGERIKIIRNELRLKTSQFVELIGFSSQREYEAIENNEKEVSSRLLDKICQISGINSEWLKHENGTRYNVEYIYLNPIENDLIFCKNLNPQEYFLTLNKKNLHVGLVAQIGKYRYQVIDTGVKLNFWEWEEDFWAIPAFYKFLKSLSDPWHDIEGIFLPTQYDKGLFNGSIHFFTAQANAELLGGNFLYDLLDVNETRSGSMTYARVYGGNWMQKVHKIFRERLETANKSSNKTNDPDKSYSYSPKTIVFQEPIPLLPADKLVRVWNFPFTVTDSSSIGTSNELTRTGFHDITVSATVKLITIWGLLHPRQDLNNQEEFELEKSDNYNIMKILFWFGKQQIIEKLSAGKLQKQEVLSLTTSMSNALEHMDVYEIPEPPGFTFEV